MPGPCDSDVVWRKADASGSANCVEVGRVAWSKATASAQGNCVVVRDSKDPDGPRLRFERGAWAAFLAGVRAGEFG